MTLFVDSAVRSAVEPLLATGLFAGVTTNPILLSRAELTQSDIPQVYSWAKVAGARRLYFQTLGESTDDILASAAEIRSIGTDIIVKIPATIEGYTATKILAQDNIPVLVTAVYHSSQALLAQAAGAHSIAPYVGRMTDRGRSGLEQTAAMAKILASSETSILAASLRSADDVAYLAAHGVVDFTISADLLTTMLSDEHSLVAAREFEEIARGGSGR